MGITGQLLMASDDMPKLSEERVELLRRIFPVADIRPMDLYPLHGKPRIFDLRSRCRRPASGTSWRCSTGIRCKMPRCGSIRGSWAGRTANTSIYDAWEKQLLGVDDGLTLSWPRRLAG